MFLNKRYSDIREFSSLEIVDLSGDRKIYLYNDEANALRETYDYIVQRNNASVVFRKQ